MSTIAGVLTSNWLEVASTVGFVVIDQVAYEMDVIPQTATNSSFLANLNGTVGSELTAARVGIVTTAYNYDQAGYYRLKDPESADTVAFLVDLGAFLMDTGATYIYGTVDPNDYFALNVANWLTFGANILYNADWYWCRVLTSPTFADECWENDTLVPVNSQVLPNAAYLPQFGPAHIRETTQSNAKLYEALTVFMAIPPRSGGGGGPMQPNSAIVGCSNWSWLAPVYKPDAASCYSYCQQYLADACEWTSEQQGASNPGDCYVEYGDGCSVAGGYSTWSAAVLNLGGPPSGGGGGDGQMHADSAVRGCIGWSWWDPVYQPDANSCAAFCVQNGADACEWYVNGDCYVEFGDSCYVEPGYSGWSAMVAP